MSECVSFIADLFHCTNRGKGKIHEFLFQIVQIVPLKVRVDLFHNSIFGILIL